MEIQTLFFFSNENYSFQHKLFIENIDTSEPNLNACFFSYLTLCIKDNIIGLWYYDDGFGKYEAIEISKISAP